MLVADGGGTAVLPDVAAMPDAAAVSAAAALFPAIGARMDAVVAEVAAAWRKLGAPGVLETPDTQRVLTAIQVAQDIADLVVMRAAGAKTALEEYASTLATLQTRVAALQPDIAAVNAAAGSTSTGAGPQPADVASRIGAVNTAARTADEDCARALRRLAQAASSSGARAVLGAHEFMEHGGDAAIALAEAALDRYRHILVPIPGTPLPEIVEPADVEVVATSGGVEFAQSTKSSLVLPEYLVRAEQQLPEVDTSGMRYHGMLIADKDLSDGAKLGWVEPLSRTVEVGGAVLTIGAAGFEQYEDDETEHPEWSQTHDVVDAGTAAATTGVGSAAGAWAGAEVGGEAGAELGAAIGTIIPGAGTAAGAIIGGAIGAIAGGLIGGDVGGKIGSGVHHLISKVGSWF